MSFCLCGLKKFYFFERSGVKSPLYQQVIKIYFTATCRNRSGPEKEERMIQYLWECLKNIFLLLLSGLCTGVVVAGVIQLLSNFLREGFNRIFGVTCYIYLTAPGIMIHELGHVFFCIIFRHRIKEVKLFSPEDDGTLGYVSHVFEVNNLYHRIGNFFIGTGPVWCGLLVIYLLSLLLLPDGMMASGNAFAENAGTFLRGFFSLTFWARWQSWLWIYLVLSVAAHITLSKADLRGAADGLCFLLLALLAAVLLFGWCGNWEELLISWQWRCWKSALPVIFLFIIFSVGTGMLMNKIGKLRKR